MSESRKDVIAKALEAEVGAHRLIWAPCSPMMSSVGRRTRPFQG